MIDYDQARFGTEVGAMNSAYPRVLDLMRQLLRDPEVCDNLVRGALQRWQDYYHQYEGKTWDLTDEELMVELQEELMDALNYGAVWHNKYEQGVTF